MYNVLVINPYFCFYNTFCVSDMLYLLANIMKDTQTGHQNTPLIGILWMWDLTEILLVCDPNL